MRERPTRKLAPAATHASGTKARSANQMCSPGGRPRHSASSASLPGDAPGGGAWYRNTYQRRSRTAPQASRKKPAISGSRREEATLLTAWLCAVGTLAYGKRAWGLLRILPTVGLVLPNVRHERWTKGREAAFGTSARWRG